MSINRRKFVKNISILSAVAPFVNLSYEDNFIDSLSDELEVHLFSKHLQFLSIKEASRVATEIGFHGLDLTVRPKGHILPENVTTDLPKAIDDIKNAGSTCKLITTTIEDVHNEIDRTTIKTASANGVQFYRSNWFRYQKDTTIEKSLNYYADKVQELSEFNKLHNIIGCYQNHSGIKVGASVWEIKKLLEKVHSDYFGAQYDIRHAVAEGGRSWTNGIHLLQDHFKTIVLKDFKWGIVNGKWKIINVPIGEGMVDFDAYFKLLKKLKIKVPVSLHLEYPLGGAEKGRKEITVDRQVVFNAMKNDLKRIQKLWKEA